MGPRAGRGEVLPDEGVGAPEDVVEEVGLVVAGEERSPLFLGAGEVVVALAGEDDEGFDRRFGGQGRGEPVPMEPGCRLGEPWPIGTTALWASVLLAAWLLLYVK